MKSQIILTTALGSSGVLSQADHGVMSLDTWCVTYLSTYLVPVATGQSIGASSSQPTLAGNSSVPVTQTEFPSVLTSHTSIITDVSNAVSSSVEIEPTEAQSGSETTSFDPTIGTLTDRITTSSGSIVSSNAITTSTGIIEPPGRSVIFLISAPNTRKRQNTDRGFVGNNNPSICTFAQSFNLAGEQLFIDGVPFFYDGEDYKELVVGPSPPEGAVTRLFGTSGQSLQVDLPASDAGFCQAGDGRVYVTFASGPAGCEVVSLDVYDERQCQNGRLVGLDTTTSAIETATSEGVSSRSATSAEDSATTETIALSSDSTASSSAVQTKSLGPISQTTESEASTTASSSAFESIQRSSATSIAMSEASTLSPASSSVLDESTTDEVFPTTTSSSLSTSTETEEPTSMESTSQASSETTEAAESSSGESTSATTTETTSDAGHPATETTTAVEEITTENKTATEPATESETTTAESAAATEDTTTAVFTTGESSTVVTTAEESTSEASTTAEESTSEASTTAEESTSEASTTTEETTTAESTSSESTTVESTTAQSTTDEPTTTESTTDTPSTTTTSAAATTTAALACTDLPNPYTDSTGTTYALQCNTDVNSYTSIDEFTADSFVGCIEACSVYVGCAGIEYLKSSGYCTLFNASSGSSPTTDYDIALVQP
ncbi:hypothetical protein FMUND_6877 [Fusarium mundagurra]|uniref:DUF7908 domain-containing protein n=1 Tax=Fusarium mundagurra TaxID=1567541 RepID=A0A8H6DG67_9HYPO|nr:hypothetical protein FMUND_6877 [Fusarium mundagurra]